MRSYYLENHKIKVHAGVLQKYSKTIFQVAVLLAVSVSVSISVFFLLSISNQVTDETDFFHQKNRIFVTDTIPGKIIQPAERGITTNSFAIDPGSLLLQVNGKTVIDSYELEAELSRFRPSDDILVWVSDKFNQVANEVIIKVNQLNDTTLSSFSNALIVLEVEEGGVADRAGIKKGDIVVAVNDISINENIKSQNILEGLSPGSIAKYDVIRGDRIVEINVQLAKYGVSLISFMIFLFAMLCYFIGGFIGLKRPAVKAARLAAWAIIGIGNLIIIQQDSAPDDSLASGLMFVYLIMAIFYVPPIILHSTYYFPSQNKTITERKWTTVIPYLLGILTMFVLFTAIIMGGEENTSTYMAIVFAYTGLMILFGFFVHLKYRDKVKKESTARSLKTAVIIVPLLFIITQYISADYGELNRLFVLIIIIIPLAYLYTVLKSRLIEVDIRVRRNVQYGVTYILILLGAIVTGIVAIYLISQLELEIPNLHLSGYKIEFIENALSEEKAIFWSRLILTLMSLSFIYLIYRVYLLIYSYMQRFFHRTSLDRGGVAEVLSMLMSSERGDIVPAIPEKASEILQTYSAGVVVFDKARPKDIFVHHIEMPGGQLELVKDPLIYDVANEFESVFRTEFLPDSAKELKPEFPFAAPIRANGKMTGMLLVGRKLSDSKYREKDMNLISTVAQQIGEIWEKQELYREVANRERVHQEIELARLIQKSSLPTDMPNMAGLDVAALSKPAYEVGGDFYEFYEKDSRLTVVMGDVSGKGTTAAMYMSKAQGMIAALNESEADPALLLKKFNKLLEPYMGKGDYLTALCTRFDTEAGIVEYSRAGHVPMIRYSAKENKLHSFASKGMGIGFQGESLFNRNLEMLEIEMEIDDVFLMLTDGVLEARNERGEEFGEERLETILKSVVKGTAEDIKHAISATIEKFTNRRAQFDDFTLCVVKITDKIINTQSNSTE